jgi:acyl carrier protein
MSVPTLAADRVVRIVAGIIGEAPGSLRTQPVLAAHEWDSLSSLEALAQIEKEFAISLDLRRFHAALTIDELVNLVDDMTATPATVRS